MNLVLQIILSKYLVTVDISPLLTQNPVSLTAKRRQDNYPVTAQIKMTSLGIIHQEIQFINSQHMILFLIESVPQMSTTNITVI
jgi:hypothetical protein